MRNLSHTVLLASLFCLPATLLVAAEPPTEQQVVDQFRNNVQSAEAEAVRKSIFMTTDEAVKFWPLFQQYQKEEAQIIDTQMAAIRKFADRYENLSDADSEAYVDALLQRDERIHDLRVKWLERFKTALPAGKAARVIQVTRRLALVSEVSTLPEVPLVK